MKNFNVSGVKNRRELAKKIKVGDTVVYAKFTGEEIEVEDKKYLIISKSDILAVIS